MATSSLTIVFRASKRVLSSDVGLASVEGDSDWPMRKVKAANQKPQTSSTSSEPRPADKSKGLAEDLGPVSALAQQADNKKGWQTALYALSKQKGAVKECLSQ